MSSDSTDAAATSDPVAPSFGGFEGRVAVVTGAGRGIGRATADTLVAKGACTAYLDVKAPEPPLDDGECSLFVHCDVTDEASVDAAFTTVEGDLFFEVSAITLSFVSVNYACASVWTLFGVGIGRLLKRGGWLRTFNVAMGLLLVAAIVPLFID